MSKMPPLFPHFVRVSASLYWQSCVSALQRRKFSLHPKNAVVRKSPKNWHCSGIFSLYNAKSLPDFSLQKNSHCSPELLPFFNFFALFARCCTQIARCNAFYWTFPLLVNFFGFSFRFSTYRNIKHNTIKKIPQLLKTNKILTKDKRMKPVYHSH